MWRVTGLWVCVLSCGFGQQPQKYLHPAADPSHHLTGAEFLKDVGSNFRALFSTHGVLILSAGAVGLATTPEQALERHFARGNMWGAWGDPGKYIGNPLMLAGIGGSLFAASRRSGDRTFRSLSYALVQGTIMAAPITQSSKAAFRRLRPNAEDRAAFPSGHAVDTFMFATVFSEHYGWKAAIPGYAIAAYVASTRLEERKHHLTDVVAGSAIGYLVGRTVSRRMRAGPRAKVTWHVAPARGGFAGAVRIALP